MKFEILSAEPHLIKFRIGHHIVAITKDQLVSLMAALPKPESGHPVKGGG